MRPFDNRSGNNVQNGVSVLRSFNSRHVVKNKFRGLPRPEQGQLILASFINPNQLRPSGNTNYAQSDGSGAPTLGAPSSGARGFIRPSALETANVDITQELLALIEAQRNFQSNAQAIQNEDEATRSIQQL